MVSNVFFLSYMESNAEENWRHCLTICPRAQRVHGVRGVKKAHRIIATQAQTDFFFIVDGDNWVHADFDFQTSEILEKHTLYVWRAQNPVNDLCYGFGGIKLYNKWLLLENTKTTSVDIATSIAPSYKPIPIVASTTQFNASPLESWRGAFREAAKLTLNTLKNPNDSASRMRLHSWQTNGLDRKNGSFVLHGANKGQLFAQNHYLDTIALEAINDFDGLNTLFRTYFQNNDTAVTAGQ